MLLKLLQELSSPDVWISIVDLVGSAQHRAGLIVVTTIIHSVRRGGAAAYKWK